VCPDMQDTKPREVGMTSSRIVLGIFILACGCFLTAAGIAPTASFPQPIPEGRQAAKPSIGDVLPRVILKEDVEVA